MNLIYNNIITRAYFDINLTWTYTPQNLLIYLANIYRSIKLIFNLPKVA